MNIFYLDNNQKLCAQYHMDKHVVKMILEYAQLLSTAHRILDNYQGEECYKKTHVNHPCALWVRQSSENYIWLYTLLYELLQEYTFRYNKVHSTSRLVNFLSKLPKNIIHDNFTEPPKCMEDEYKKDSVIGSYRNYYIQGKKHISKWKRGIPPWYKIEE